MSDKSKEPSVPTPESLPINLDEVDSTALLALLKSVHEKSQLPPEIYGDKEDDFVATLRKLKGFMGMGENSTVIYPGSGAHAGVARVFGREYVIHVDPDERSMEALGGAGYRAVVSSIEDYTPKKPADGIVALNSYGVPTSELIAKLVKPGGFVIANNWTHWAAELARLDDLELAGAVMPAYEGDDATLLGAAEIPEGSCDLVTKYFTLKPGGVLEPGTPENHTYSDTSARYPDALFVFRRQVKNPTSS